MSARRGAARQRRRRSAWWVLSKSWLIVVFLVLVIAATAVPASPKASPKRVSAVLALGDSVPYGTACECTPYPKLSASDVSRVTGHAVDAVNDAVAGYRSADVLEEVQHDRSVMRHVHRADAVMVEVGANDIAYSSTCGTDERWRVTRCRCRTSLI